ncbi:MAG: hypothetical protein JNM90_07105 [Burkholderiales bacterium]|nr:hypothetical protein [Burkholderiales bacterium]
MAETGLVAAQFILIGVIVWLGGLPRPAPLPLALCAAGIALGVWTLAHNRPGNFNIRPTPRAAARLVTGGPYRRIRHPMYAALLLLMAGLVAAASSISAWAALCALAAVLAAKARREEAHLRDRFPGYAEYAARTRRFVPGIW